MSEELTPIDCREWEEHGEYEFDYQSTLPPHLDPDNIYYNGYLDGCLEIWDKELQK